jgi:hypothetical protein
MKHLFPAVVGSFLCLLASCATVPPGNDPVVQISREVAVSDPYLPVKEKLVEAAGWMKGRKSLRVGGRSFGLDCTGIVLAAYWYAGIDLAEDFGSYTGNGVRRLYYYLDDRKLLYNTDLPSPGDIIFWDNTWDANENGLADDTRTHVGMVVSMERETGAGTYLHYNYAKGIVIEDINLLDRDNPAANSPLRMKSLPKVDGYRYLSSQLVREMGRGYELNPSID